MRSPLADKRCKPCEGGTPALDGAQITAHLEMVSNEWKVNDDGTAISARFGFRNYYETTAFVNAVVWIAHSEDHHPDISFGYRACTITYSTHAVKGLSENDFICAAKIDDLIAGGD